jgi:hypothetical protein
MRVCALLAWNLPVTMVFDDMQDGTVLRTWFCLYCLANAGCEDCAALRCGSCFKFGSIGILLASFTIVMLETILRAVLTTALPYACPQHTQLLH